MVLTLTVEKAITATDMVLEKTLFLMISTQSLCADAITSAVEKVPSSHQL
jgi:hypothetical protein